MTSDFRDEGLIRMKVEEKPASTRVGAPSAPPGDTGKMARHQEDIASHVTTAAGEIERLRRKQEDLEREKRDLESLARKQREYEEGKREIAEQLRQSLVLLEKEENQILRTAEVFSEIRARFRDALEDLGRIHEESWSDHAFASELDKATAIVASARMIYKRGVARVDAASWHKGAIQQTDSDTSGDSPGARGSTPGFGSWLKAGLAFSLPITVVLCLIFVVWLWMNGYIPFRK